MKHHKKTIVAASLFLLTFLAVAPLAANAGIVPCGKTSDVGTANEVCSLCHLFVGIKNIIDWGTGVMVFAALAAIVLSGIFYIISIGNQEMMTKAKNIITQTLIGVVIVLSAWLIVTYSMYLLSASNNEGSFIKTSGKWHEFDCKSGS